MATKPASKQALCQQDAVVVDDVAAAWGSPDSNRRLLALQQCSCCDSTFDHSDVTRMSLGSDISHTCNWRVANGNCYTRSTRVLAASTTTYNIHTSCFNGVNLRCTVLQTASLSLSLDVASFARLTPTFSLIREHTLDLETAASQSRVPEYGTVWALHCDSLNSSNELTSSFGFKSLSVSY